MIKKIENTKINHFKKSMRTFLLTSRFNEKTRIENKEYREKKLPNGCIYGCPEMICQFIPQESKILVIEMNNDINKIMGIGFLVNKPHWGKHRIYNDTNYNRFTYIGKYRISREDMTKEEEDIMTALDILCFYGNDHMKRGHGLKSFPAKILWRCRKVIDLTEFVENMFNKRWNQPSTIIQK